ncbi:MAG TPA: biotin--[acetyl-CoA-carboxylase] ligase [Candidatus Acidoferrales bacterium]|nr:biotin--[acetyl-CoA-carboxylase] ligase [Candidatus Acidoferrales bacterium]
MSKRLNPSKLQEGLRTRLLGKSILFSEEVASTNEWAKKLASRGALEGWVAIAETQTHGRGRLDREWISPLGGLWFSLILRPKQRLAKAAKLTYVGGLAVAETLHEEYGLSAQTKWPNDVLVNGRKICGILGEASTMGKEINYVILGIGINANFDAERVLPESIRAGATSLETELNRRIQLEGLFIRLLEKLEATYALYNRRGFSFILKQWKKYACFLGKEVEVRDRIEKTIGLAYDVDMDGSLILMLENGVFKHVFAGEVYLRTSENS